MSLGLVFPGFPAEHVPGPVTETLREFGTPMSRTRGGGRGRGYAYMYVYVYADMLRCRGSKPPAPRGLVGLSL